MLNDIIHYTPMYVTLFWAVVLLLSNRRKNLAKFFLGVFMVAAFLVYFSHAVFFNAEQDLYLYVDPIYTFASLLVYPLYFVYIRILTVDVKFRKKNWLLFIPALIIGGLTLLFYLLMSTSERSAYIGNYFFNSNNNLKESLLYRFQRIIYYIGRGIFVVQVFYFLIKGSQLIKKYNKRIVNFYSKIEDKSILWVNLLLISFVITSIVSILFTSIGKYYFLESPLLLLIPSAVFSVLLFVIGFQGYMQNHSVLDLVSDEENETQHEIPHTSDDVLKQKLIHFFENEKIYRNPDLKITDVSAILGSNRTYVSRIINHDFQCSFSGFVSRYRVKEAKELLALKSSNKYTLEYIAEKVGFGSLHSFIRVFKKSESCTPGNYRESHCKK